MSRKKIPESEKRIKISISINQDLNKKLEALTYNKSKFIEELIKEKFNEYGNQNLY